MPPGSIALSRSSAERPLCGSPQRGGGGLAGGLPGACPPPRTGGKLTSGQQSRILAIITAMVVHHHTKVGPANVGAHPGHMLVRTVVMDAGNIIIRRFPGARRECVYCSRYHNRNIRKFLANCVTAVLGDTGLRKAVVTAQAAIHWRAPRRIRGVVARTLCLWLNYHMTCVVCDNA